MTKNQPGPKMPDIHCMVMNAKRGGHKFLTPDDAKEEAVKLSEICGGKFYIYQVIEVVEIRK